jgi:kinesin family protein 15
MSLTRWLEEIDRKQAEIVAAQIALEKHRQRDQLLKTENEMLKVAILSILEKIWFLLRV